MQHIGYQDFFTKLDRISGFAILNVLWVISVVFIVTIPAATVGLFAVMTDWVRGHNSEAFARFFGAIRQHGLKASLIGLLDAVIVGLLAFNLHLIPQMGLPMGIYYPFLGITAFIGVLVLMSNLYIWPLLVTYDLTINRLIDVAVRLSINHFGWTACLLLMTGFVLMLSFVLPAIISVLLLFSSCAYLMTWGAWHIIQRYDADLCQMSM
jgi:uncharacterized membrane protein YesL